MNILDDPFTDEATATIPELQATDHRRIVVLDPGEVDANYQRLLAETDKAHRATKARRRAALARDAAHGFSEYARALRRVAETKGSEVDHLVALDLAGYCETQAVAYVRIQAEAMIEADREGSV